MEDMYDVCIVGAGSIGSSAAKHLTEANPHLKVLLVGPFEPKDRSSIDIHGAYFDLGRITRKLDSEPIWMDLNRRSMERYTDIEQRSGINFFKEVGFLGIGLSKGPYISSLQANALKEKVPIRYLNRAQLKEQCPYLNLQDSSVGIYTKKDAGYVNIRNLVLAQRQLAQQSGCIIIDKIVRKIHPQHTSGSHTVVLEDGTAIKTQKVLLCTGAFTHCRDLLPDILPADAETQAEGVIKIEIPESQLNEFSNMPSIVIREDPDSVPVQRRSMCYILPPILYPDDKYYLKIGHGKLCPAPVDTPEQINGWYNRNGEHGVVEKYLDNMKAVFFPTLANNRHIYDYCVTAHTPSGYPYIDMVTPSIGVAIIGNGRSAKNCDELGNIAARMITAGCWSSDIPQTVFKFKSKTIQSKL